MLTSEYANEEHSTNANYGDEDGDVDDGCGGKYWQTSA